MNEDGSRLSIYLNSDDDTPKEIIQEDVKVYAAQKVMIKDGVSEMPVYINMCCEGTESNFYFDGKCRNQKVEGVEGILNTKRLFL